MTMTPPLTLARRYLELRDTPLAAVALEAWRASLSAERYVALEELWSAEREYHEIGGMRDVDGDVWQRSMKRHEAALDRLAALDGDTP